MATSTGRPAALGSGGDGEQRVRYAVVGLGHITQSAVLPAFAHADNSELVAFVSGNRDKQEVLSKRYGVERVVDYDGYDELLESGDVDAVYIALPNHLHCEYTVRAAERGVHVLCEKPMAVTDEECARMIRVCDEHDVRLMIAYRLHFDEANMHAVAQLTRGQIGELRYFSSSFSQDVQEGDIRLFPVEKGGGPVYDMGVYCINAARYLFRSEPIEVSAIGGTREDDRYRASGEMVSAVIRFPEERLATFTCSFGAARVSSYRVVGTRGDLFMEPAYDYGMKLRYEMRVGEEVWAHTFPARDQFGPELVYFSRCVLEGHRPEPDGVEGREDVRIIEAIYESVRSGRPVPVEPLMPHARPDELLVMRQPPVAPSPEIHVAAPSEPQPGSAGSFG